MRSDQGRTLNKASSSRKIPVVLLTGFLGSGKTTLLSQVLAHPAFADTAVIINEFGEVSIDHLIVAEHSDHIVELRGGCLCCTIRGDLVLTLRELHRQRYLEEIPAFKRVVVETSGLADPVPLIHTLMANLPLQQVYQLDAVICVVDGEHGVNTLATHATAADQVALADLLLISKVDCVERADLAALATAVRAINPGADLVEMSHGMIDPARLLERGLFQPEQRGDRIGTWLAAVHDPVDHGSRYTAHIIRHAGPLSLAGTSVFLNRVVNELGDQVLRIKGLAAFREKAGRPALLHAVQNKFYPVLWLECWPDDDETCRLVIIGRDLNTRRIDELFNALCV